MQLNQSDMNHDLPMPTLISPETVNAVLKQSMEILPSTSRIRAAERSFAKLELKALTGTHDLQFVHIRPFKNLFNDDPHGGTTIAYHVPKNGGNVVELATAVCSPKDTYDKVYGKLYAARNFALGKRIKIRLHEATRWGQQLKIMFESVC